MPKQRSWWDIEVPPNGVLMKAAREIVAIVPGIPHDCLSNGTVCRQLASDTDTISIFPPMTEGTLYRLCTKVEPGDKITFVSEDASGPGRLGQILKEAALGLNGNVSFRDNLHFR